MISFAEFREEALDEAAFSEGKITKVAELVAKIMSKDLGGKFYKFGKENFNSKLHGKGVGIRFINTKGKQVRFNWTPKEGKKTQYLITSCDYWDENNLDNKKPTLSIKIGSEINIVQVVAVISQAFRMGRPGKLESKLNEGLSEARSSGERKAWLKSKGLPTSYGDSEGNTRKRATKAGLLEELEAFLGGAETNDFESDIEEAEKKFEATPYADPNVIFKDIEDLTRVIASGGANSLLVAGIAGVGKTYHVEETLKTMLGSPKGPGAKWRMFTGSLSPFEIYKALFFNRDKIVFFDDVDSAWKTEDTVNMMKSALDTKDTRYVGWASTMTQPVSQMTPAKVQSLENDLDLMNDTDPTKIGRSDVSGTGANRVVTSFKLPAEFEFSGAMIFTSNKSADFFAKLGGGAIRSRSFFVDVKLKREDILNRIKTIAIVQGYSPDVIEDALGALEDTVGDLTVRSLIKAINMKELGMPNWAELASKYA